MGMTSVDPVTGSNLLRHLRESRGWSWADLARALRETAGQLAVTSLTDRRVASIQRTVARWESPTDSTSPGERYQYLLAHLYARTASGTFALGPGSDFATLLDALRHFGSPEHRIRHLVEAVTRTAATSGGVDGDQASMPDEALVRQLADQVNGINSQIGSTPLVRLQLQLAPVVDTCQRMVRSEQHDDVLALATDAFALAARLAFETRDDEAAELLYRQARETAGRLPNRRHRAAVLTSHAMVTLHATGNPEAAGQIARAAVTEAHRSDSYALRARAHAIHAEVSARAGQAHRALTALERAWTTVEQLAVDQRSSGFNADRLDGFDGLCALYVGDADHAHARLERSLATLTQPRDAVQRGIVGTDLALARLRLGDPAASVTLLHEAVDLAATTGGRVPAQRLRHARKVLRQARAEAHLAELDDHIHDVLIGR